MMRHTWKPDLQGRLSWFLIVYLMMLLSVLMSVHVVQRVWDDPGSAWRPAPAQERQKASKRAVTALVGR
jgi:hypothetical protein